MSWYSCRFCSIWNPGQLVAGFQSHDWAVDEIPHGGQCIQLEGWRVCVPGEVAYPTGVFYPKIYYLQCLAVWSVLDSIIF